MQIFWHEKHSWIYTTTTCITHWLINELLQGLFPGKDTNFVLFSPQPHFHKAARCPEMSISIKFGWNWPKDSKVIKITRHTNNVAISASLANPWKTYLVAVSWLYHWMHVSLIQNVCVRDSIALFFQKIPGHHAC